MTLGTFEFYFHCVFPNLILHSLFFFFFILLFSPPLVSSPFMADYAAALGLAGPITLSARSDGCVRAKETDPKVAFSALIKAFERGSPLAKTHGRGGQCFFFVVQNYFHF